MIDVERLLQTNKINFDKCMQGLVQHILTITYDFSRSQRYHVTDLYVGWVLLNLTLHLHF